MNDSLLYWDLAHRLDVARESPREWGPEPIYKMAQLDSGIKFFILALEELGATTKYSCEGHPFGAYVAFDATAKLAMEISETNTFYLRSDAYLRSLGEVSDYAMYAQSLEDDLPREAYVKARDYTEEMRVKFLRESAKVWMRKFGDRLPKLRKQLEDLAAEIPLEKQFYNQQGV